MNERLFISPLAEITTLGDDKIALSIVGRRYTVEDKTGMIKRILGHAEVGTTAAALTESLADTYPDTAVEAAVKSLVATRVLVADDARMAGDGSHLQLQHRREMEGNLSGGSAEAFDPDNWLVAIAGQGALADALAQMLAGMEITVDRLAPDALLPDYTSQRSLLLSVADYEDFDQARRWNQQAVEKGMASLFIGIDWTTVQCGPLVLPRATACYECYYHRVRATRRFVAEFDVRSKRENILYHAMPSKLSIQWAVAEASRIALRYLSGTLDTLHQSLFCEIDTLSGDIGRSMVLRLPRCPVCGSANTSRPVASVFQHAMLRRKG